MSHPPQPASPWRLAMLGRAVRSLWFLEDELTLLPRLVPAGGVVVDVGANRGAYMVGSALLAGPRGRVVAVEPQPGPLRTALLLRRAFSLWNVTLVPAALGDQPGALSLIVPYRWGLPVYGRAFLADAPDLSAGDLDEFTSSRRRRVPVTTLDGLAAAEGLDRLDFLKCDIEGAELRMLVGGVATIERHRPAILLEIEERHLRKYGHTAGQVLGFLTTRGYDVHALVDRTVVGVDRVHAGIRNYLFLPRS